MSSWKDLDQPTSASQTSGQVVQCSIGIYLVGIRSYDANACITSKLISDFSQRLLWPKSRPGRNPWKGSLVGRSRKGLLDVVFHVLRL